MTDFEVEVKEIARAGEYTIQLRVTEVVLGEGKSQEKKAKERLSDSLQQVAEDIDRIWKESTKIQDKDKQASKESMVQDFPSSSKDIRNVENYMVGGDDQRKRLVEDLTRSYSGEPKVIPIVGMGVTGKTTLANEVYNDACIRSHFDVCAWATVSQQHNVKEILLSLLRSTKDDKIFTGSEAEAELADMLQKSLKCKRYLIILNDMWKGEAWDAVRLCFPFENKGSGILLTTRNIEEARCAALPSEYENIGKQIVDECHGLPLTIVVVVGLLKSKRAIEDWSSVEKDVKSFVTNDPDERCSRVLGLSYNHLTDDLKTCLLYFEFFPENIEIPVKHLMRIWMGEGLLNLENDLEGEAEKCLQELVDRCLVLVCKKSLNGTKIRSCKGHDLIYELCMREVQRGNVRSKFLSICISGVRIEADFHQSQLSPYKLLPVLDLRDIVTHVFPVQILSLIWLRYLSLLCKKYLDIPPEICRLWNLQTFIVQGQNVVNAITITFPEEIWGLMQLRHLKASVIFLSNPPTVSIDKGSHMVFPNIQTISYLYGSCCMKKVISGIQNVKKLGFNGNSMLDYGLLNNLVYMPQLEILSFIRCYDMLLAVTRPKAFPATLKKLKLYKTYISWSYLDIIAELPNHKVLKLMYKACRGNEWRPNVRGFARLKLYDDDEDFDADAAEHDDNYDLNWLFNVQNNLHSLHLDKIPIEFVDIYSLQLIELQNCSAKLMASARRVQEEQESLGSKAVDVDVRSYNDPDVNIVDMAHASVASLMRTIESLLTSNSPMQSLTCDHREEFCALHEKVSSLEVFLKNFEKNNISGEMTDLELQIKEVANIVKQKITVTEFLGNDENLIEKAQERLSNSLQQVAEGIDHIWKESTNIQDKVKQVSKVSLVHDFSSSTNDILNVNNNMVRSDDQKERLLEDLTITYPDEHRIIPIVGMGGIGKTTLAKEVYNHESILRHFDVRAWATVSQQHKIKEILLSLLQSTIKMDDTVKTKCEKDLKDMLQKSLKRKRYLIVLDDIWSYEVWDGVRRCFPTEDFNAGSRILLTTRNNKLAPDSGTENLSMQMNFMDQDESWNLFKSAAFSNKALPYEFETVGKQIADECHGLPLAIVVVAGLLKSKREIEEWENVAKYVKSFVTNDPDEQCSRVLGLSYNHLTSDLKTSLLHFGIFPEDSEIPAKRLVRSWMAEGFLKLENDLEGEAEKCLQELADRSLVLVCKKSQDGTKIRSRKLRHRVIGNFPLEILSLIWLRYLSLVSRENFRIPPEICRLWNLKTLIVKGYLRSAIDINCPVQIWGLMQLRHLKLPRFYLPDCPSGSVDKERHLDFSNIKTISYLSPRCCMKKVIMGIQNVKELGICGYETDSNSILNNLVHLQQLETLSFIHCFYYLFPKSAKAFPAMLKKLKLKGTYISWSYLNIIAELPNLEVLKYWKATNDNFPVLERLIIRSCHRLKEIPIEFVEIHTLQLIELTRCLPELGESAARIQQEQERSETTPWMFASPIHVLRHSLGVQLLSRHSRACRLDLTVRMAVPVLHGSGCSSRLGPRLGS
ncbi:hypothetical protein CQW23_32673 [Capsicum baccatum]|uniref:NB-ARC domain-containing protein n=1 Tax=Capsicum baccatum TaxID=33114 RepID=A0A2G2V435_CAPBA|nr:hypothetical protein CQW23_32673 [Capsicum baccatum]